MKNTFLLISCLLWGSLHAQQLSEIARPVPAALCSEAPMPQDLAKKYARAEQARQNKFVTPQRETNSTIDNEYFRQKIKKAILWLKCRSEFPFSDSMLDSFGQFMEDKI